MEAKTVIDAVNHLKGEFPTNCVGIIYGLFRGRWSLISMDYDDCGSYFTTDKKEFNQCVEDCSNNKGWENIKSKPVFTKEMEAAGTLPCVGMEFMWSSWGDGDYEWAKVIAKHGDEYWLELKGGSHIVGNLKNFKSITPPIELIDGEPYKFNYSNGAEGMQGAVMRYSKAGDHFFFDNTIFKREHCTNIQLLEVKS